MGVTVRLRGSKNSNIKIVDRAVVPRNPSGPGKKKIMLIGFFLGLMGGVGLAFLLVYLDNSVKEPDDVEKYLKAPTLGIIPAFNAKNFKKGHDYGYGYGIGRKRNKRTNTGSEAEPTAEAPDSDKNIRPIQSIDLITMTSPRSSFSESYRSIRTALMLSSTDLNSKALVMTSALPEEGKSTTIANLAVTLAQTGKNVLLVDGDFRKPRLHKIFQIKNMNGLTNYLTGKTEIKDLIKTTPVPNLYLINSGPVPPNPAELLGSKKMGDFLIKLKQTFDLVLIDTPPMLSVTDALVLGPEINGVLLVV
jgi:capsular exopolysaccharide synthesis family protein